MSSVRSILCRGLAPRVLCGLAAVAALAACGQKGPLFLPTDPAAANRATLPQVIRPGGTPTDPAPRPLPGASQPSTGGQGTGTADPLRTQ